MSISYVCLRKKKKNQKLKIILLYLDIHNKRTAARILLYIMVDCWKTNISIINLISNTD